MFKLNDKTIESLYLNSKTISKAFINNKLVFNKNKNIITKPYYCEVEYLESTGTQWIDTGYIPNNNTSVEMIVSGVSANSFSVSSGTWFMGARRGYLDNTFGFYYNPSNQNIYYSFGNNMPYTNYSSSLLYEKIVKIEIDKTGLYINDGKVVTTTDTTFTTPVNLSLFGLNNNGTTISFTSYKLHSCKISENGVLVRDYIPVLDNNMKPCLYDKVSGKPFYNQRTGEFLYGRQIHEVEYLESDGNQYINTEYNINTETDEVELNYQLLDETVYKWLFGEHDNNARFALGAGDGIDKRNLAYGTNTIKLSDTYFFNNKHNFKANKDGVFVDEIKFADYKSFTSTSSIWLFSLNLSPYTYGSKTKIWGYKHKRNGSLIRNYIPAVDENGKGFMFDRVTHSIFDNAGTGEFLCDKKYTELEYIESTGEQWIDTGIYLTNDYSVEIDFELTEAIQSRAGIYGGLNSSMSRHGALLSPTTNQLESGYGLSNPYYQLGLPSTTRHIIKQQKNKVYYDGNLVHTFDDAIFEIDKTAPLMNFDFTNYKPAKAKYYSSKWWDGDELIRDFIPVLDLKNTPCMYDRVTKQFFYNKGTGQFLYSKV